MLVDICLTGSFLLASVPLLVIVVVGFVVVAMMMVVVVVAMVSVMMMCIGFGLLLNVVGCWRLVELLRRRHSGMYVVWMVVAVVVVVVVVRMSVSMSMVGMLLLAASFERLTLVGATNVALVVRAT